MTVKYAKIDVVPNPFVDSKDAGRIREKQEVSFAHRLWILMRIYENDLDGKKTDTPELMEKLQLSEEDVREELSILKRTSLIEWGLVNDSGTPYGIELTGYAIEKLEKAPTDHYEQLEVDVKELQTQTGNMVIKKLEIEKLKQETSLKKWEVMANVTATVKNASKWFGLIFGGH